MAAAGMVAVVAEAVAAAVADRAKGIMRSYRIGLHNLCI